MRFAAWVGLTFATTGCAIDVEMSQSAIMRGADAGSPKGDGGLPDASDPEVDASRPSVCPVANVCPASAFVCEEFAASVLDTAMWQVSYTSGAAYAALDSSSACSGERSFHLSTAEVPSGSAVYLAGLSTQASAVPFNPFPSELYIRAYLRWRGDPSSTDRLILIDDAPPSGSAVELQVASSKLRYRTRLDGDAPVTVYSERAFPRDEWACVEWHVRLGRPGEMRVWLDDIEVPELHYVGNTLGATRLMDSIGFSIYNAGGGTAIPSTDLWVDSIVIDDERIGCD